MDTSIESSGNTEEGGDRKFRKAEDQEVYCEVVSPRSDKEASLMIA